MIFVSAIAKVLYNSAILILLKYTRWSSKKLLKYICIIPSILLIYSRGNRGAIFHHILYRKIDINSSNIKYCI